MSGNVTPFLRLQLPPFDTIPWDQAVNGNMTVIDAFIAQYMALPNYVGAWQNNTNYLAGSNVLDALTSTIYQCQVTHVSPNAPTTFAQSRATNPSYWSAVYTSVGNAVEITMSDTPPGSSKAGDFWWDTIGTQMYVRYNDGNSIQWVAASNVSANVPEAPVDGHVYGRQNNKWVQIA